MKRIAKNTLLLYFRMMAVMFVGLFTSRVQLEALGVADYGLYQVAMATVSMFCFLNGSLGMASSRFLTVEMGKGSIGSVKRVFSTVLSVHFVLASLVVVLLETIGIYVLNTKLNIDPVRMSAVQWAYQCAVVTTFLSITQVPYTAAIIAHERMSAFAYMSFYDVGVKLLIVYLLFVSPIDRLKTYATLLSLSSITTILIYRIYCIVNFTEARFRHVFDRSILKPIFSFVGWQLLSQIVFMLALQTVVMLNQHYFGPVVVAAATIATTVNSQVMAFINNFKMAANPQIIKLFAAKQYEEAKSLLTDTILISVYLLLVLGVPLFFCAPEVLRIWLGANVPEHAASFLRIVIATAFFSLFDFSFFTIITADGRMKYNTICDVVFYGCGFAGIWIAIKCFGCPVTTAIGQGVLAVVLGLFVKPILLHYMVGYRLRDFIRIFIPAFWALALCVGGTFLIQFLRTYGMLWALPVCVLSAACNGFLILSFAAPAKIQNQVTKLLERFGPLGRYLAMLLSRYFAWIQSLRAVISSLVRPTL